MRGRLAGVISAFVLVLTSVLSGIAFDVAPAQAAAGVTLTVTPITWDMMGLDSNNVNVGPNRFPIGVKVCNTGTSSASNVTAAFAWTTTNTYISLQSGTNSSVSLGAIANGSCASAYYNVEIQRNEPPRV